MNKVVSTGSVAIWTEEERREAIRLCLAAQEDPQAPNWQRFLEEAKNSVAAKKRCR